MGLTPNRGVSIETAKASGPKQDQDTWRASLGVDPAQHIRLVELNHVRYQHSDIEKIITFLEDFGFDVAKRTDTEIYFRGYGPHHYDYVVVKGDKPKFLGGTFRVESHADLERASKLGNGTPIQDLHDAPGGGKLVTIYDPAGWPINLIFGQDDQTTKDSGVVFPELLMNTENVKTRLGACHRFSRGPAAVFRVGHFGICYKNFPEVLSFYVRTFNFVPSDLVFVGSAEKPVDVAAFLHIDRGDDFTDHHTFFLSRSDNERVHHCSFEVHDHDTQLLGHEWLQRKGYKIVWGVGRHLLGSQIFDYWRDPSGFMIEHYADGDLVNKNSPVMRISAGDDMMLIWGPDRPAEWLA
ncbi:hypothetical protein LTR10_023368 [Elasticomyces elasticus]|uniref:VOC domain-containing protein n=1 Tax=Exophiala sideris TaxID=1016849 RepID=A0ABR0IUI9_9EURO|nr:hypothetical protein LTR10_023368 [Elasticomyces elasticus]KAK5023149.1 hypothetical protein LTR13_011293 [Exophiala sideris]KAK5023371.1 hypothetical protein LTS07_009246 [Exophiala sideris]KAK5048733.1 hypothetical protein LTR69_011324 [Exophiala sideris]KAK5176135.1 hypothetical protein LTR44_011314 [Eurotiomycetes sp. CCFEE 6388]